MGWIDGRFQKLYFVADIKGMPGEIRKHLRPVKKCITGWTEGSPLLLMDGSFWWQTQQLDKYPPFVTD